MKKAVFLNLPLLWASAVACGTAPTGQPAATAAPADSATTLAAMSPETPPPTAPRYDVRGIFDPGMGGIIAYALKVPHGWLMQQSLTRAWNGAVPNNQLFLSFSSPDKQQVITILPQVLYHYDNSPGAQQVRAFMAQRGTADPTERRPMLPLDYLKQVALPLLNRQPATRLRLTGEHADQPKAVGQGMQQASGYVDGVLPNGHKVRLSVGITLLAMNPTGTGELDNWSVLTDIAETTGDLATVVATSAAIAKSLVPNPAWQQKDNELQQRAGQLIAQQGQAALQQTIADNRARQDQIMQRFHQNVANQQAQRNAINGAFRSRMNASSQAANAYADYAGDKTLYQNPDTGERVKVQGSLGNVYQDAQGTVLNSSQPLSGSHVDWQQLQQVELKNY